METEAPEARPLTFDEVAERFKAGHLKDAMPEDLIRSPDEETAYRRWRFAAQAMQTAFAAYQKAKADHDAALIAMGNLVAPPAM